MNLSSPSYIAQIYIGGDIETARRVCREFVWQIGECVTLEPVEFIYKGGAETGVRVGFINYPRFPQPEAEIWDRAVTLADRLRAAMCQHSYSIVATDKTVFETTRVEAAGSARASLHRLEEPSPSLDDQTPPGETK